MRAAGIGTLVLLGAVGFGALTVVGGSWYVIDQGERGVIVTNGRVTGVADPGWGFKLPIVTSVHEISVRSHLKTYDKMMIYSADQQPAEVRISVSYRQKPEQVAETYAEYGSLENVVTRLIDPNVYKEAKIVFGQFTAVKAVQDRAQLNALVASAIQRGVEDGPAQVEGVQIENIDFSEAYEASIEQRMLAEVEVQKVRQNADRERVQAEITVTKAKASADAVRAAAQAEADAIRLRGEAEAAAIQARAKALGDNPGLVQLVQAERWDGKLPQTMLPGATLPMVAIGK